MVAVFYTLLLAFKESNTSLTDNYSHFPRGILTHVSVTSIKMKNFKAFMLQY